jgi:DNA-damage-inducible protein D
MEKYSATVFDDIKHVGKNYGREFWLARELAEVLDYPDWHEFEVLINRAKHDCATGKVDIKNHFVNMNKTASGPDGAVVNSRDVGLSKYASYCLVQNADTSKKIVQLAQAYFGMLEHAAEDEIEKRAEEDLEDKNRLVLRGEISQINKKLASCARAAGVETDLEYAKFQDEGYKGLYGGLSSNEIKEGMNLPASANILDYMTSEELEPNDLRISRGIQKLGAVPRHSGVRTANSIHKSAGEEARDDLEQSGKVVPEDLPRAKRSIQQIRNTRKKTAAALQEL